MIYTHIKYGFLELSYNLKTVRDKGASKAKTIEELCAAVNKEFAGNMRLINDHELSSPVLGTNECHCAYAWERMMNSDDLPVIWIKIRYKGDKGRAILFL